jgi:hypothetical protein
MKRIVLQKSASATRISDVIAQAHINSFHFECADQMSKETLVFTEISQEEAGKSESLNAAFSAVSCRLAALSSIELLTSRPRRSQTPC